MTAAIRLRCRQSPTPPPGHKCLLNPTPAMRKDPAKSEVAQTLGQILFGAHHSHLQNLTPLPQLALLSLRA